MPKMKIDGQEVEFTAGESVIQVCDRIGTEIPRFCYHEKLHIAGNCRMCLVEAKPGPPKPQASCALPAAENMEVITNSPMVKKAREGVMEFLLINHPLDCPICDQGGECDLQDQAMAYGTGKSRYHEHKRAVEDKYMGPLIKPHMTRCIHCTRCIRFVEDVAGVPELGAIGRGEHMEITSYLEKALTSEISANVIDLCPVGALTSKPYAFHARPWEVKKTESIDVMDAVGSNIRIDTRGEAVLRILPRLNEEVNEDWISDKTRYACDGLKTQRLDKPYIRKDGKLQPATWGEALSIVAEKLKSLKPEQTAAIVGNLCDVESMFALKRLMSEAHLECRQDGAKITAKYRSDYIMNTPIAELETADMALFIGANPRIEAPLVNTRLRKAYLRGGMKAYNVGTMFDATYPVEQLGGNPQILKDIASGKHPLAEALRNAKKPVVILGEAATAREDGVAIFAAAKAIGALCQREGHNGFNLLHHAAARVGALDIGFIHGKDMTGIISAIAAKEIRLIYLLGVDEIDTKYFDDVFVIYQGHHGDAGAHRADVIFPGAAYTEKDGLYVNTEGRVQEGFRAVFPPGEAKEDWQIIAQLSHIMGKDLGFNSLSTLRAAITHAHPQFTKIGELIISPFVAAHAIGDIKSVGFDYALSNFYRSCVISRVSKTMAQCTELVLKQEKKAA